jgi:hypothetical protein
MVLAVVLLTSASAFPVCAQPMRPYSPVFEDAELSAGAETRVPASDESDSMHCDARPTSTLTSLSGMSALTPKPQRADDQAQVTSPVHARSTRRRAEDRPSNTTH